MQAPKVLLAPGWRKLNGDLENDAAELDGASEVTGARQERSGVTPLLRRDLGHDLA